MEKKWWVLVVLVLGVFFYVLYSEDISFSPLNPKKIIDKNVYSSQQEFAFFEDLCRVCDVDSDCNTCQWCSEGCCRIMDCRDTDEGINLYEKGETYDRCATMPFTDACHFQSEEDVLIEHWCGDNRLRGSSFYCSQGCNNGACINDPVLGEQKTAVILVKFSDSPEETPFTAENIGDVIFEGNVQNFIMENSFNLSWLNGTVYGWYALNRTCDSFGGWVWEDEVIEISDDEIYFLDYERLIIISDTFCNPNVNAMGTVGRINLSSNDGNFISSYSIIRNSIHFFDPILSPSGEERTDNLISGAGLILHELGHNFGAWHANAWDCGSQILYGDCKPINYGSLFDVMGRGWVTGTPFGNYTYEGKTNAAFHYNTFFKHLFGWVDEDSFIQINQNGTYLLKSLENEPAGAIIQPQLAQLHPFYLEYRVPYGYDAYLEDPLSVENLGGIFVYKQKFSDFHGAWVPGLYLLDMSPTVSGGFDEDWLNVALLPGESFFDEGSGVKVTNIMASEPNSSDSNVTFSVEFFDPRCLEFAPVLTSSFGQWHYMGLPGDDVWISLKVENPDTFLCNGSIYYFNASVPEGWQFSGNEEFFLASGETYYPNLIVFIPQEASLGNYSVNITVTRSDSLFEVTKTIVVEVVGGRFGDPPKRGFPPEENYFDGRFFVEG